MYEYDRRAKKAAWDDDFVDAANKAKDAVEDAMRAAEQAKKEVNAMMHLASKQGIGRSPLLTPISTLDLKLHKAGSPSDLYAKAASDLGDLVRKVKGRVV